MLLHVITGMQLSVVKTRKEKIKCVTGKCFGYVIRIRTACGEEKCMPETNLCSNAIYESESNENLKYCNIIVG